MFWSKPEVGLLNILRPNGKRTNYDCMFLMALALNRSIEDLKSLTPPRRLEDFTYKDAEMAKVFDRHIRHADFTSISVSFRIATILANLKHITYFTLSFLDQHTKMTIKIHQTPTVHFLTKWHFLFFDHA